MRNSILLTVVLFSLSINAQSNYKEAFQSYWSSVAPAAASVDSIAATATGVEGAAWTAIQSLSDLAATKPPTNEADASSFIEAISSLRTQLPTEVQAFQSSLASAMSDFSSRFPRTTLPTSLLPTSIPSSSATGVVALSTSKTTTGNGSAVSTGGAEKMVGVVGYVAVAGGLGVVAAIL